jgi:hypothetical protein
MFNSAVKTAAGVVPSPGAGPTYLSPLSAYPLPLCLASLPALAYPLPLRLAYLPDRDRVLLPGAVTGLDQ